MRFERKTTHEGRAYARDLGIYKGEGVGPFPLQLYTLRGMPQGPEKFQHGQARRGAGKISQKCAWEDYSCEVSGAPLTRANQSIRTACSPSRKMGTRNVRPETTSAPPATLISSNVGSSGQIFVRGRAQKGAYRTVKGRVLLYDLRKDVGEKTRTIAIPGNRRPASSSRQEGSAIPGTSSSKSR